MEQKITNFTDWQPALFSFEKAQAIDDIHQTIRTILETPKGSAVLYPTFGSDIAKFVDYPVNIVTPHIVRETILALEEWEPRITLDNVSLEFIAPAQMQLKVKWSLKNSGINATTLLELDRGN